MNAVSVDLNLDELPPEAVRELRRVAMDRKIPLNELLASALVQFCCDITSKPRAGQKRKRIAVGGAR